VFLRIVKKPFVIVKSPLEEKRKKKKKKKKKKGNNTGGFDGPEWAHRYLVFGNHRAPGGRGGGTNLRALFFQPGAEGRLILHFRGRF